MSHFTVLVIGDDVEEQLAPYQENNMGDCPEQYLEFDDEEDENLKEYQSGTTEKVRMPDGRLLNKWDDEFRVPGSFGLGTGTHEPPKHLPIENIKFTEIYPTFEQYMKDWCGYKARDSKKGRYGCWRNPRAKWDWYSIGGRWTGFFKLKPNARGTLGRRGTFDEAPKEGWVDQARVRDIDFAGMAEHAANEARKKYRAIALAFGGEIPEITKSWESMKTDERYKDLLWDERRAIYRDQPALKKLEEVKKNTAKFNKETQDLLAWVDLGDYQGSEADFIERASRRSGITFAVLKDGEWYERGEMGWWGCVSDEKDKDTWEQEFQKLVNGLDGKTLLTVVDCHI